MNRLLFALALALSVVACNKHSAHWDTLTEVESFINTRPDSALLIIEQIAPAELSNKEERAKHSLLHSVALYKSYIDKSDFEILQPAIEYYKDHGSSTDKLLTNFYKGIIYQNQGNDAQAMISFLEAIEQGGDSEDLVTKAQVYYAQSSIYYSLLQWDRYCNAMLKCAELYNEMELTDYYHKSLVYVINGYTQKGDKEMTNRYIDTLKKDLPQMNPLVKADFYDVYTTAITSQGDKRQIRELLEEYISIFPEPRINYNTVAFAYYTIGEYKEALNAIQRYNVKDTHTSKTRYYALLSDIYNKLGNDKLALENYKIYQTISNNKVYEIFKSDTQFMEDKHSLEMQKAKAQAAKSRLTIIVLACIVALVSSLYIINIIRKRLKDSRLLNTQLLNEKAVFKKMYNEVIAERDALNKMVTNNTIKEETMTIIKSRLGVLNTIIVSHLSEKDTDIRRANKELEALIADRGSFIRSTRLTLEENYPHFFVHLHDKGLEEHEIDFCCLYAIGIKGKEIKAYTNLSRHYKDSSEVRQKLGLMENDTNLSNYLQKLLKSEGE